MNPPYMEGDDPNYNGAGMGFSDKSIRAGFIRRVYSILSVSSNVVFKKIKFIFLCIQEQEKKFE